jgi:hypothetical protein
MTPDATATGDRSDAEVVASLDATGEGTQFIIADITCDDAWLSIEASDAPSLPAWR